MDSLKRIITANIEEFPSFGYYIPIIEKVERNQEPHPDIAIECCNALIQGISKTIIFSLLSPSLTSLLKLKHVEMEKILESDSVQVQFRVASRLLQNQGIEEHKLKSLVEQAFEQLSDQGQSNPKSKLVFKNFRRLFLEQGDWLEIDFLSSCETLISKVGNFRNDRGDICHGRAVPKQLHSDLNLSRLVMEMTESLLRYTLASFFAVSLERKTKEAEELRRQEKEEEEGLTQYESNPEFNDLLDEEYVLDGKLLYSQALYTLYYEDYEIQLQAYLDEKDKEEAQIEYEHEMQQEAQAEYEHEMQQEAQAEYEHEMQQEAQAEYEHEMQQEAEAMLAEEE